MGHEVLSAVSAAEATPMCTTVPGMLCGSPSEGVSMLVPKLYVIQFYHARGLRLQKPEGHITILTLLNIQLYFFLVTVR